MVRGALIASLGFQAALASGQTSAPGAGLGACGRDRAACARESALIQLKRVLPAVPASAGKHLGVECTLRDFRSDHPDFYTVSDGWSGRSFGHLTGCVEPRLGPDGKPVYKSGGTCFNSSESFAQWYKDVPGVNRREALVMSFAPKGSDGTYMYDNSSFFPMDGRGFADSAHGHNHWFTMELHSSFIYQGGETFKFRGDDDVWVFINGSLALDLGGVHTPLQGEIALDSLQLTEGAPATLDLFFAERQPFMSNFRVETDLLLRPSGPEGSCTVWGDPHALGFDSAVSMQAAGESSIVNVFGYGDFWLVKSPFVSVQGRYGPTQWTEKGLSATLGLAIGGAFLQGHALIIEPRDGHITWDGVPVLQEFPSEWSVPGLVAARYREVEEPIDKAQLHRPVHGLEVELPLGMTLTVNRWQKHMDLTIRMHAQAGGQDGHCGNFNGESLDDTVELIKARMELRVSAEERLFPKASPFADEAEPAVRSLSSCAPAARAKAEAQCREALSASASEQIVEACVFDRCFGGASFEA